MCVDGDFSYIVPPVDGDKIPFYESVVKTLNKQILKAVLNKEVIVSFKSLVRSQQIHRAAMSSTLKGLVHPKMKISPC